MRAFAAKFQALLVATKKQDSSGRKVCWYFRGSFRRFGGIDRWLSVYRVGILYIASEKKGSERDGQVSSEDGTGWIQKILLYLQYGFYGY